MEKCKFRLCKLKNALIGMKNLIPIILPLLLMDIFIRILATGVKYNHFAMFVPSILFSAIWIGGICAVSHYLGKIYGRIFYGIVFFVFYALFITHSVYYPYTGFFFSFNLLQSADEGSEYIIDVLKEASTFTYISCILVFISGIFGIVKFSKPDKKFKWKQIGITFLVFTALHLVTPTLLGRANKSLEWDTWRNPRNVYQTFSDSNKNIKICGIFEYSVKDLYMTFLQPGGKEDPKEIAFLEKTFDNLTPHKANEFTGIFEGKNVIFLQLEGIDSWLLTEEDMPNLYKLKNNSIVFGDHYSYYTGGGSTFNSELAVTTGFVTPISYAKNAYSFNTNSFPASLPNQFKKLGYEVNAFHMNSGEYYARELNYLNWGYDNYYSLMDDGGYTDISYQLDRELVMNEFFYKKLFKQEKPFVHYIISYTNHTPFSLEGKTGKLLANRVFDEDEEIPKMSEEEVARFFAKETDLMVELLLGGLESNELLENTVIVAFADHYLYTLNDKTILDQYKNTENNLINQTPFFIWTHDMANMNIPKVNSQIDILPTVLNLMGIDYCDEYYVGRDIFDEEYPGYVFFSDYSWYDGVNYVEFGEVTNNTEADPVYIHNTNTDINNLIRKNDLVLKYDYFKKIKMKK